MKKLIFATTNENKLFEVKKLLKNYYDVVGLKEIGFEHNIIENKSSIIGNSIHKALFVKEKTGFNCFADDTGLEVDVLDGAPGVHSKRYAGINASSEDNINKLLNSLQGVKNRKAQFKTVISLNIDEKIRTFTGICKGKILNKKKGEYGFGYDPIFVPEKSKLSFAEMTIEEKNKIGHRGIAIQKLFFYLTNLYSK